MVLSVCMGHSGGDRCFVCMVGGSRSPSSRASLGVTRAGLVASPAVTRGGRQSLWFSLREQTCC